MAQPVKLITKPSIEVTIQQAVVKLLQEALVDADAGKVSGIIIVSKEIDGTWYHRASGSFAVREEIGALEVIKHDLILHGTEIL